MRHVYAVAVLALVAHCAMAQQVYVFNQANLATGHSPLSVATGDVNGDAIVDLILANAGDNTVSVFLGKPDGTFTPKVDYPTGGSPTSVAVGDFNNDGKLDLAVANDADDTVSILLGRGDGTFQPGFAVPVAGPGPAWVSVGDFNRDGRLDLAVANYGNDLVIGTTVSILLGNGDGTFRPHVDYPTGPYSRPDSIAIADFNGDGKLDLAVANGEYNVNTVSILLGNGDGTFQSHVDYATGSEPQSVIAADFNGDHKFDLAVANSGTGANTVSILVGNGDGTFQPHVDYPAVESCNSVVARDFNGDGKPDLAVGSSGGEPAPSNAVAVSVLLGNGDGTFQPPANYAGGPGPFVVTSDDFNGDGVPDLVIANEGGNILSVLLGNGNGTFIARTDYTVGTDPDWVSAADFNSDGKLDLAVVNYASSGGSLLLGNGDGTFQAPLFFCTQVSGEPYCSHNPASFAVGDYNHDGKLDLVVANEGGPVSVVLGNGNGTFQPFMDYLPGINPVSVASGDLDGDGNLDLAVTYANSSVVSILLGNGDGTFRTHVDYATSGAGGWVIIKDFNGDGRLDLAVSNSYSSTISILLGNGDGTFQARTDYATGATALGLTSADFNSDGKADLAVASYSSGTVSILLGNGDGSFQPHVDYSTGPNYFPGPIAVTTGDFNGDGKADLVVSNSDANAVAILLGNGDGTFQRHMDYSVGTYPASIAVGDLSTNGSLDMAVANQTCTLVGCGNGTVSVLLNSPTIAVYPNQLNFGSQSVGRPITPQEVLLSNPSSAPVKISSISISGDFERVSNTCGNSIAPMGNCTISVIFTPIGLGISHGAITITDNALRGVQVVTLAGFGVAGKPRIR